MSSWYFLIATLDFVSSLAPSTARNWWMSVPAIIPTWNIKKPAFNKLQKLCTRKLENQACCWLRVRLTLFQKRKTFWIFLENSEYCKVNKNAFSDILEKRLRVISFFWIFFNFSAPQSRKLGRRSKFSGMGIPSQSNGLSKFFQELLFRKSQSSERTLKTTPKLKKWKINVISQTVRNTVYTFRQLRSFYDHLWALNSRTFKDLPSKLKEIDLKWSKHHKTRCMLLSGWTNLIR